MFGALHGLVGIAGFAVLLLAPRGPPRGEATGISSFGRVAAALLGITLVLALPIVVARLRRRRISVLVIGLHATMAISGIVILAAYAFVG